MKLKVNEQLEILTIHNDRIVFSMFKDTECDIDVSFDKDTQILDIYIAMLCVVQISSKNIRLITINNIIQFDYKSWQLDRSVMCL